VLPVITLTTDFGNGDAYAACVKGAILSINAEANIVDICHSISPQNIFQAAFILSSGYRCFPMGTIHIVVVDPGVGSQRKAVILRTPYALFVAPDNGVLSYIINEVAAETETKSKSLVSVARLRKINSDAEAIAIINPDYWRCPVSTTFHGRDIFAPVAAHLSKGVPMHKMGKKIDSLHAFPLAKPYKDSNGKLRGRILHIDRFGNLVTNIKESDIVGEKITVEVSNRVITELSKFYAEKKGLTSIFGSSGYLEIALPNDNAAAYLESNVGDEVEVSKK
jgi:S-adenosylmethionine hydrolase